MKLTERLLEIRRLVETGKKRRAVNLLNAVIADHVERVGITGSPFVDDLKRSITATADRLAEDMKRETPAGFMRTRDGSEFRFTGKRIAMADLNHEVIWGYDGGKVPDIGSFLKYKWVPTPISTRLRMKTPDRFVTDFDDVSEDDVTWGQDKKVPERSPHIRKWEAALDDRTRDDHYRAVHPTDEGEWFTMPRHSEHTRRVDTPPSRAIGARVDVKFYGGGELDDIPASAVPWSTVARYRIVSGPEWIEWKGKGDCPVDEEAIIDVKFHDDRIFFGRRAGNLSWARLGNSGDIVAYRGSTPKTKPAEPDGKWIEWDGMGTYPSIDSLTLVDIKLRDGRIFFGRQAGLLIWSNFNSESDIVAYRATKRTGGVWKNWKGGSALPLLIGGGNARVDVKLRNGREIHDVRAKSFGWKHTGRSSDIVAYRVAKPAVPDGWTEWTGGNVFIGLAPVTRVDVMFRDGEYSSGEYVKDLRWTHLGGGGDIVAYRESNPLTHDNWTEWWGGGKCPLPPGTKIDMRLRDGLILYSVTAGDQMWKYTGGNNDIVAYRRAAKNEGWKPHDGSDLRPTLAAGVDIKGRDGIVRLHRMPEHIKWSTVAEYRVVKL